MLYLNTKKWIIIDVIPNFFLLKTSKLQQSFIKFFNLSNTKLVSIKIII